MHRMSSEYTSMLMNLAFLCSVFFIFSWQRLCGIKASSFSHVNNVSCFPAVCNFRLSSLYVSYFARSVVCVCWVSLRSKVKSDLLKVKTRLIIKLFWSHLELFSDSPGPLICSSLPAFSPTLFPSFPWPTNLHFSNPPFCHCDTGKSFIAITHAPAPPHQLPIKNNLPWKLPERTLNHQKKSFISP